MKTSFATHKFRFWGSVFRLPGQGNPRYPSLLSSRPSGSGYGLYKYFGSRLYVILMPSFGGRLRESVTYGAFRVLIAWAGMSVMSAGSG
ncbi:hypothetical protein SBA6_290044 [Candidatus Sulfopaludibacter sp. SbA6]|nr:hypothetical protein SBA6_290044 [Candidatus Sulfopaludibacter sp. SbA6]